MRVLVVLGFLGVALVSTVLIWVGSRYLERSADTLSTYYGLPRLVQGAIVLSVASSLPELLTAIIAPLLHDEFELGVAVIIGSAIFNILVIPAAAALASPGALTAGRDLVYKEAQFYMVAVAAFILMCSLAVIYYPVPDAAGIQGVITVELAVLLLGLYGLYVFTLYEETIEHTPAAPAPDIRVLREWGVLLGGFVLILVGVEGLIRMAVGLGGVFGIPTFIWGLTVIAAVTSLPDTFVSVRAAQRDHDVTSIANVFGSNVFDLLVAVPAAVLVAGAAVINFSRAIPLLAFLVIATIVLFTLLRTRFELSRLEAYTLAGVYLVFLVWVVLEALGFIGILL